MRHAWVMCGLVLALSACGKSAEDRMAEAAIKAATGNGVQLDQEGEKVTLKTADGDVTVHGGDNVSLPGDFPDDIPLPDGYKVESMLETGGSRIIALLAPGDAQQLYAAASEGMQAKGWKQTVALQGDGQGGLLGYEKDGRKATLSFTPETGGKTAIGLQLVAADAAPN